MGRKCCQTLMDFQCKVACILRGFLASAPSFNRHSTVPRQKSKSGSLPIAKVATASLQSKQGKKSALLREVTSGVAGALLG